MHHFLPNLLLSVILTQIFTANCCIKHERDALLEFKAGVDDPGNRLVSWNREECCNWEGITCSKKTGHIIKLNLQSCEYPWDSMLIGKINQSLYLLSDLEHLNLSCNFLHENNFSNFFSSYRNLKYLDLHSNDLSGNIPLQVGILSKLEYLDLSRTHLSGTIAPQLGNLSRLEYLDLSDTHLSGTIPPQLGTLSRLEYLDLSLPYFSGTIPPQIGKLLRLEYLNLEWTNLSGAIPPQLGNLSRLEYLNLKWTNLSGAIPSQLGNLSRLEYLNLEWTNLSGAIPSQLGNLSRLEYLDVSVPGFLVPNIWWLSHLTSLKYLNMDGVNFQDSKEWVQALNMLPLLQTVILGGNNLTSISSSISVINFSNLQSLSIYDNYFNTTIPDWIWNLTKLTQLEVVDCSFTGPVPSQLGNLNLLTVLDLSGNSLEGPMPLLHNLQNLTNLSIGPFNIGEDISDFMSKLANETFRKLEILSLPNSNLTGNLAGWVNKMPNLIILDLSGNSLSGTLPNEIGNFTSLEQLYLDNNSFTGEVSEIHLAGLSNLTFLALGPDLAIRVDSNWVPTFLLYYLSLADCTLGPQFPSWLQNQSLLSQIFLSNTGIVDTVPNWFWNLPLYIVDLSHNKLGDELPSSLENLTALYSINFKNNSFQGEIPSLPHFLNSVDLSYNHLSGSLPTFIGASLLVGLDLSNNYFNGTIEQLTCGLNSLASLNLERNNLFGKLPRCWPNTLEAVMIAHNKLSGSIPSSMGDLNNLKILQLNNNSLRGEIPPALQFCRNLFIVDLGENNLHGHVPEWITQQYLGNLIILRLRSNKFTGAIPVQLFHLKNLQVLDIARNDISGMISHDLELLPAMVSPGENQIDSLRSDVLYYDVSISVTMKGLNLEYTTTLLLLSSVDLSRNNLMGTIPRTITSLHGLRNLNLSNNQLTGPIPFEVGEMKSLESLDLHNNELSGIIPHSISNLNFLATLNLSYNNLSGKIPSGNQLQTLNDPYNYVGNVYLCGPPLNESCNPSTDVSVRNASKSNVDLDKVLLYLIIVLGFGFGFWIFFGMLLLKRNWRYQLFQMVDIRLEKLCILLVSLFERVKFVMAEK